jgi:GTP-binding protein
VDGQRHEPIEHLTVQVPEQFSSRVIDHVTRRKGEILNIEQKSDRTVLEFSIPARGIIGLRNTCSPPPKVRPSWPTASRDTSRSKARSRHRVPVALSVESRVPWPYAIDKLQDRGKFFVDPGEDIYVGQVIGENPKPGEELVVNVVRTKKLTNMRASGTDDKD